MGVLAHTADIAFHCREVPLLSKTSEGWLWDRKVPEHGRRVRGQLSGVKPQFRRRARLSVTNSIRVSVSFICVKSPQADTSR